MVYPDTSVLIAAVSLEPETARVLTWLATQQGNICISDWTIVEFASALSVKLRMGTLSEAQHRAGTAWFRNDFEPAVTILPISRGCYREAAQISSSIASPLRGPDALHLAVAAEHRLTLATFDQPQEQAALTAGIAIHSI